MYGFYQDTYGGTALEAGEFPAFLARAQDQLDLYERCYRVSGDEKARKMALCAMAELIGYYDAAQNGQGAPETTQSGVGVVGDHTAAGQHGAQLGECQSGADNGDQTEDTGDYDSIAGLACNLSNREHCSAGNDQAHGSTISGTKAQNSL